MVKLILKRILQMIPTLLIVVTITFCLTRMLPGDPAVAILGIEATDEDIAALRAEMNLDKSLPEQYVLYLDDLMHGDFGYSYSYRQDVLGLIISRIPNTISLTLVALAIAAIIGTAAGIIAAVKQNTIVDYIVMLLALVGVSMPNFWLALMLVLKFSVEMNLLPVMGMGDISKGIGDVVLHMILPCACLASTPMATFARTIRSSMVETLSSDYVRCLRARGVREWKVICLHSLKNALPPLVTVLGLQIAGTFTGAIITEGIFSWPGMGTMINTAINNRDYSLIQGAVLFSAIMFVFCNMLVDIAYMILNPKVKGA
ncbi:MAG TPA: ABC transporter permease [Candidatus Lachnoclostridium stercorigallinarum]|uniref:ABC transporter permease n=1 Tax=Candidatus Lachnoclostridium stercorigallinarum TaxID=2838634 RepID=A0A9D2K724_9FIRM|nr:ABC transporter permease [Candidatus Lachnoclostridium stercorigallinarum]